ncbi:MAG: histidine--tRNA ligase [Chloroflexi bacterium]|nr:MAG: histidine--tRNA ligase [Chloroflexota bacterium]
MSRFQAPRGMRDLTPEIAAAFDVAAASIAGRALRYGYARLETPAIEDVQVFIRSSGETSDVAGKEMYEAVLHGEGGLALRPEGTAPVARAYLEHGMHRLPQPVRLFYLETMWRGQRPQLGRWRQFWQWGLECFGAPDPVADVEIVEFSDAAFRELGLTEYELELNTIGDGKCRAKVRDGLRAYFEPFRDRLSDDSRRRLDTNVLRVLDSKEERDQDIVKGAPRIVELLCEEDIAHFDAVKSGLERLGVAFVINDRLVRGLDYYTRTVFEFILTNEKFKGRRLSVAGGGRYDGLLETMGGPPTAGTGVAGGVDVLLLALETQGVTPPIDIAPQVYVISNATDDGADRLQLATQLRAAGFRTAIDYSRRSLDKQLESAAKHGARVAIIRGTPEARGGNVVVRDLRSGEQRVTRLNALLTVVASHLGVPNPRGKGPDA